MCLGWLAAALFLLLDTPMTIALLHAGASPWDWTSASPESQGISSQKLDALKDDLAVRKTKAFLVLHDDKLIYEWYAPDHSAMKPHYTASMAKAIVGGLALGVAMSDGRISLDDKAANFIPQWNNHPMKSRITIRHLGSHTSGIQDAWNKQVAAAGADDETISGWEGDFWRWRKRDVGKPDDAFTLSRDTTPVMFEPGTRWAYSNPGIAMLDYCVAAALKDAPQKDIRTLLRDRVMQTIGVADGEWSCGYGKTETVDGLPLVASWGGGSFTARAVARIGRLMLREGNWEGQQLLTAEAVRQITSDAGTPGPNGMGWWSNNDGHITALPSDAFWGAGAGAQVVLVVPSLKLVAVRSGESLDTGDNNLGLEKYFFMPLAQVFRPRRGSCFRKASEKANNSSATRPRAKLTAMLHYPAIAAWAGGPMPSGGAPSCPSPRILWLGTAD